PARHQELRRRPYPVRRRRAAALVLQTRRRATTSGAQPKWKESVSRSFILPQTLFRQSKCRTKSLACPLLSFRQNLVQTRGHIRDAFQMGIAQPIVIAHLNGAVAVAILDQQL